LALATFFQGTHGSYLEITTKAAWLSGHAPGIDESVAEKQIAERHASWGKRLPQKTVLVSKSDRLATFRVNLSRDVTVVDPRTCEEIVESY
jgi:hypothetical protein